MSQLLETVFPKLGGTPYSVTSPRSKHDNCIAWAAGVTDSWWWPDPDFVGFWPAGISRELSIAAFIQAFESLGYSVCDDALYDPSLEKVALFAREGQPTHAARQLSGGTWTSKCGKLEVI